MNGSIGQWGCQPAPPRVSVTHPLEAVIDRLYEAFYISGCGAYVVIKECMNLVGRPGGWPRRPHLPMDDGERRRLAGILEEIGVLGGRADDRDGCAAE